MTDLLPRNGKEDLNRTFITITYPYRALSIPIQIQ